MFRIKTILRVGIFLPFLIFIAPLLLSQPYPVPEHADTTHQGRFLQRTMNLLVSSTPEKQNTVKILVYGQSISEQDWWLSVKSDIESRFPDANIIMKNRAIGGFASQMLHKTVRMDVQSFYPDLVLFHVYGSHIDYETIIKDIRTHTTAEIGIQTDHYNKANDWSDNMSYNFLPAYAEKYSCQIIDIRRPWIKYLNDNNYEPSQCLKDNVHLNDQGNFVMAELIKPYLYHKSYFKPDTFGMVTTFEVGKDIHFIDDTLTLRFRGNRVDAIANNTGLLPEDSARILLDGFRPSLFQGTWYHSRPYNDVKQGWPWNFGSVIRIRNEKSMEADTFTCTFDSINTDYTYFEFHIESSKSGFEGAGSNTTDFLSDSKRVYIEKNDASNGGDWHVKRSHDVTGATTEKGDKFYWYNYSISEDTYIPKQHSDQTLENAVTLFQGITNDLHELKIIKTGPNDTVPIKYLRVYRPVWNRDPGYFLTCLSDTINASKDGDTTEIEINSNTAWQIASDDWISAEINESSQSTVLDLYIQENNGSDRQGAIIIEGYNVDNDTIIISQKGSQSTTNTTKNSISNRIQFYPNPVDEAFNISGTNQNEFSINIYDLFGRKLNPEIHYASNLITISMSKLSKGIYVIVMTDGDATIVQKVIKK